MSPDGLKHFIAGTCAACLLIGCAMRGSGTAPADADTTATDGDDVSANANGSADPDSDGTDVSFEIIGDATAGAALYGDVIYACSVCHGETGEGTALAPSVFQANALELQNALTPGSQHTGGTQSNLTAQDFADLAAFLDNPISPPDVSTNGTDSGDVGTNGAAFSAVDEDGIHCESQV